ncbi:MAG TPA: efflux RND transporter permease subunit, partial [Pirellulales bacterium]|nr:efflux RND transporter permease subunit [Pirellulales bacterium]
AMEQVSGPVIAVGLVLSAVFVPCAFISGITGQFFRQFALTIAVSTIISAFNSLTLSPALTALLLRSREKGSAPPLPRLTFPLAGGWLGWVYLAPRLAPWVDPALARLPAGWAAQLEGPSPWLAPAAGALAGFAVGLLAGGILNWGLGLVFRTFNRGFNFATGIYARVVGGLLRVSVLVLIVYGGLLGLTYKSFVEAPKGFIPAQDKGYLLVNVQLPDSASVQRTRQTMLKIEKIAGQIPGVKHTVAIAGQSILLNANAPNFGAMYVMLDDFHHRVKDGLPGDLIAGRLQTALEEAIGDGLISVFGAPPVEGLGTAGGFKIVIEDRGDAGPEALQEVAEKTVQAGRQTPDLRELFSSFRANTPWLYLDIDRSAAKRMGLNMADVFNTLQVYLGSLYVNDFNRFGRTWQVNVQAGAEFRNQIDDLKRLKIRNMEGKMTPLASLADVRDMSGPAMITRYNLYRSAPINGNPQTGVSSGQALETMERVARSDLPRTMRAEWTELALLQLQTGNTAMWVFLLAVVLVFLVLAAQYESWSLPLAVILVVPMCLLCSVAAVLLGRMDINIFTQVGFVVLIGLACKNAILIVEFAKVQTESGVPVRQATLEACKLRLRPIIMTSLAFILGVVPLMVSEGAGAEMRRTLGAAVFGGMLGVTLFGIFLTPVFYFVIQRVNDLRRRWTQP